MNEVGKVHGAWIAERYLERIAALDKRGPAVNSVIEVNPDALALAEASDKERKSKRPGGRSRGFPC